MEVTIPLNPIAERINKLWLDRSPSYTACIQTTVSRKTNQGWQNLLTKLECVGEQDSLPAPFTYVYPEVLLIRRLLEHDRVRHVVERLLVDHLIDTDTPEGDVRIAEDLSVYGKTRWWHSEWTSWPADIFTLEPPSSGPWSPLTSLIALEAPYFRSLEQLLSTFFTVRPTEWHNQFRGQAVVILPDFRARVSRLRVLTDACEIGIETGTLDLTQLVLRVCVEDRLGVVSQHTVLPVKVHNEQELSDQPALLAVALLDRDNGEVLHEKTYRAGLPTLEPGVIADDGLTELEQLLLTGESETIEFKRELGLETGAKLAKTAVAFANSKGGTIVFGVDDDHRVVGCDTKGLADAVTNILRSNCDPPPDFACRVAESDNRRVFLIDVSASSSVVHVLKDRGPFIRATGTNRTPTSYELARLYQRRGVVTSELWVD